MHHARLSTSPRLRCALRVMQATKGEISSYELMFKARICAPGTVVSELRANGVEITCRQVVRDGQRRFFYTLVNVPKE
ncbi:MAG: hypothetical protein COC12_12035 [Rhodobacteraceae bacterium]|nr:MAG: hypothetical protein COC12_12035 [Paracoccaceae bacterium]